MLKKRRNYNKKYMNILLCAQETHESEGIA